MTRTAATVAVIATFLVLAACGGSSSDRPVATSTPDAPSPILIGQGEDIVLGVSVALSGDQVNIGRDLADAVQLAVKDLGGAVKGRTVRVTISDDGCTNAEMSRAVANAFVEANRVAGVIGPMCTTGAQAADGVYERAGVVHISPSATRVDLSSQGEQYFFRVSWRDDVQAALQARYAWNTLGAESVILVDDGDPYGRGLADGFADAYEALGGRITSRERIARGTTDMSPLARRARSAAADAVVFEGLNPEGVLLVRALKAEQYAGTFVGPDGLLSIRDFLGEGGAATEGAVLSGGPAPDEAFITRFREATGRVPTTPFVLQAYDAATALIKAVDATAIENADSGLTIDRVLLAANLRSQRLTGLTGAITFDERGDRSGESASAAGLVIYRVTDGRFVPQP